ncbi:hypothetical protein F2Q70_00001616 [Brassica cretica]|uniref:Uncharacterized protein n=1 Tax=Brassica cretica TaxID=69181 RepID=A0A8S9IPG6_BRACR|nr:hypothetical protein F2Q70_00001616 [Brassica cretica]
MTINILREEIWKLHQRLASIDTNLMRSIDNHPTSSINAHPVSSIKNEQIASIYTHIPLSIDESIDTPEIVDRHPSLEQLPGYIVELEPVEERVHESEASRNADSKHLRPLICAEEAAGFHKRVKRIHDPVKFVVPCDMVEVEFPIPPDKGVHLSSYVDVLDDHQHVEASQRGLRFRDEVDKDPTEATSIDTDRIPSNDTNKLASIDATTSPLIDTGCISEQKKFDVCGNLRDEDTTT